MNAAEPPRKVDAYKAAIMQAWEAYARPCFQRQLGRDVDALIEAGKAALLERYGGRA